MLVDMISTSMPYQAVLLMITMGSVIAWALCWAERKLPPDTASQIEALNQLLPQTQCAQCGYPGCRPYAMAIHTGKAPINLCPPGGQITVKKLAELTGQSPKILSSVSDPTLRAVIRESDCIGCTLCIEACPVDAIIGATQKTHTVIEDECTGCELCLPPCPVDCIDLVSISLDTTSVDTTSRVVASSLDKTQPQMSASIAVSDDCVRCGECIPVCPKSLTPVAMYWQRNNVTEMEALRLAECIECSRCDRACPSELPLATIFSDAKGTLRQEQRRKESALYSEARFSAREERRTHAPPVSKSPIPTPSDLLRIAKRQRVETGQDGT